ncbi:MAG: putative baseplate assembly protein [Smithella sp.]
MSEKCEDCGSTIIKADMTPVSEEQRPGLTALRYRVGTHSRFKETMKTDIANHPALRKLATREDNDPSIALLDSCAAMLDVLTFYQERIANEGFLRTATERRSIGALAGQIGYQLDAGVAASVPLAFTVEDALGAPGWAAIEKGTKVQSIPGPQEKPQIFETIEPLEAKAKFNCLTPKTSEVQKIRLDMTKLYLKGTNLQLKQGDILLIVGDERQDYKLSENWDVRIVHTVTTDADQDHTIVTWLEPLGKRTSEKIVYPAQKNPKVYVMRQRAALFGHNAPDPRILDVDSTLATGAEWKSFAIDQAAQTIDLDAPYPKILKGGWLVLSRPGLIDDTYTEAYQVTRLSLCSRKDFALSSDITRIVLDTGNNLNDFGLRNTTVYAQSEELEMADVPFRSAEGEETLNVRLGAGMLTPVEGSQITLDRYLPELQKGQLLIVSGKPPRLKSLAEGIFGLFKNENLSVGSIVQIVGKPLFNADKIKFFVKNPTHFVDFIEVDSLLSKLQISPQTLVEYVPAAADDETISEAVTIESLGEKDGQTVVYLADSLKNVYDRATVSIFANCVRATHGETKKEILGSGNAAAGFQKFVLKQTPLTYVSAATSGGSLSTLEIRVNDILWQEVPSLYGQNSRAMVYTTRIADDGKVTVQFGDGITGARLPSGVENVTATYRIGTGQSGLVKASQISLLMTRPLGVKAVINPGAPSGASDPETRDQARQNAPYTVLTFGRIVSLADYEYFTRRFSGIAKAQAVWLWNGRKRFVHITIAGVSGYEVKEDSNLFANLHLSIKTCGLPQQQFLLQSYTPLLFTLKANLQVKAGYLKDKVTATVKNALLDHFSFEKRSFGQSVAASEVIALMQSVNGVEMVDLDLLKQENQSGDVLTAHKARWNSGIDNALAAELLTINPQGIELIALEESTL